MAQPSRTVTTVLIGDTAVIAAGKAVRVFSCVLDANAGTDVASIKDAAGTLKLRISDTMGSSKSWTSGNPLGVYCDGLTVNLLVGTSKAVFTVEYVVE